MVQEGPSSPAQSRDDEEHNLPRTGVACMTFFIVPTLRNSKSGLAETRPQKGAGE